MDRWSRERFTAVAHHLGTFSAATSAHWKDVDGQVQEATEWSRCIAWGALAEIWAQYVAKGSHVYVAGRLHAGRTLLAGHRGAVTRRSRRPFPPARAEPQEAPKP